MSEWSLGVARSVEPLVLAAAKAAAPRRTGRFAASLRSTVADTSKGVVIGIYSTVDRPQIVWLKYGTAPHMIFAVNNRFLRFVPKGGGKVVFRRSVHHPGTRRDEKFFATMVAQQRFFADAIRSAGKETVRGLINW